jgi:V/A-type H+/Na+-transporting ATPase subunit E
MKNSNSGIDQLIERVRIEAIDKAKIECDEMLAKAKIEAQKIIDHAQKKTSLLLKQAETAMNMERQKLFKELELATRDFIVEIDIRLREQMFFPVIKETVRANLKEPGFLKEVLEKLIIEYVKEEPSNLDVLVPKELRTMLAAYFAGAVFDRLDKKCDVRLLDDNGIEGFVLIKRGEHYVWDFRVETIAQELMRLVEPSLKKYFTAISKSSGFEPNKPAQA